MEIQRATNKKKQNNKKTKQKQQFCGCLKTQTSKTQPSGPKNSGCETVTQLAKQLNFGDRLNIIFVISISEGIFRREPFYFFRQIQDEKRYFRVWVLSFRETRRFAVIRCTRCVNLFYIRGWVFEFSLIVSEFFGSEFSVHPRGLSFKGLMFETPRGSEFLGAKVWVFEVWVLVISPILHLKHAKNINWS